MKTRIDNQDFVITNNWGIYLLFSLIFAFTFMLIASNAEAILYDFNNGKADGWTIFAGTWEVKDGVYQMPKEVNAAPYPLVFALDGKEFGEFTIEAKIRNDKFHSSMNQSHDGFAFGIDSKASGYALYFRHHAGLTGKKDGSLVLRWMAEDVKGGFNPNADVAEGADVFAAKDVGIWHVLKAEVSDKNKTLKAWVDGKQALDVKLANTASGKVGLWAADIGAASFDDISINGAGIPATDVQPASKLSTKWGSIKAEY
jgi:hypothetical protein